MPFPFCLYSIFIQPEVVFTSRIARIYYLLYRLMFRVPSKQFRFSTTLHTEFWLYQSKQDSKL